ncbi:glycosyltransferase family 4 protein [Microvirga sp. ACRRW]|uniref:glycosyltransferase family 4 protein n=1 Tax=Microvirga sp. ACRRW TaxID=2918205 RepID=UPI001EF6CB99|nr:glycosyltransferase family 4 protein [Microvirga sp. ACRRW]MCG7392458.1 glycosyltransferase family 4 protein [Microvirga sp. ACRRW]
MQNNGVTGSASVRPRVVLHYWGRRGGGSLATLLLAQHLSTGEQPCDVVFSLFRGNHDLEAFKATGLPIVFIDRPHLSDLVQKAWSLPRMLREHADRLAALKPKAVIMTMNSPFAWPFMGMLQRRGLKVAYTAHDAAPHPGDYAATWQRITQDLLIKGADRVVALSRSVAKRVAERIPSAAGKISVVPLEVIYPTKRMSLPDRNADEPIKLLFFGRLIFYKGLDRLAEVLTPLKTRPDWRLTIAGAGPLEGKVRELFAGWPQVNLEFGWISDQRSDELYAEHDLLLCPYTEASQSGVISEALSWALPSIVMPMGALPEQIGFGTAGLVAEDASADAFRRSLELVLDQPDRLKDMSRRTAELLLERQRERGWFELASGPAFSTSRLP